jgi:flavin reductase (DIM6/NTAB) family NADH-FMN oxidoreductase RutF
VGRLNTPMFVVTARGRDGERAGCLIGFATQVSVHPPRFLACISKENRTFDVVSKSGTVVVHFLSREQRELAELFGGETGDEVDKFELCEWREGPDGVPVLAGVAGWFAGRVLDRFDLGDHVGLWLDPFEAHDGGGNPDLGFQDVKQIDPGHPVQP